MSAATYAPPPFYRFLEGLTLPDDDAARAILNHPEVALIDRDGWLEAATARADTLLQKLIATRVGAELYMRPAWRLTSRGLAAMVGCSNSYAARQLGELEVSGLLRGQRVGRAIWDAAAMEPRRLPTVWSLTTGPGVALTPFQLWAAGVVDLLVSLGYTWRLAGGVVRRGGAGAGEILRFLRAYAAAQWRGQPPPPASDALLGRFPILRQLAIELTEGAPLGSLPFSSGQWTRAGSVFIGESPKTPVRSRRREPERLAELVGAGTAGDPFRSGVARPIPHTDPTAGAPHGEITTETQTDGSTAHVGRCLDCSWRGIAATRELAERLALRHWHIDHRGARRP